MYFENEPRYHPASTKKIWVDYKSPNRRIYGINEDELQQPYTSLYKTYISIFTKSAGPQYHISLANRYINQAQVKNEENFTLRNKGTEPSLEWYPQGNIYSTHLKMVLQGFFSEGSGFI